MVGGWLVLVVDATFMFIQCPCYSSAHVNDTRTHTPLPRLQLMIFDSITDISRSRQVASAMWPGSGELMRRRGVVR